MPCRDCKELLKAIDRYIEKADNDLSKDLKKKGYAQSKETAKSIESMEQGIEDALLEETDYLTDQISACADLQEVKQNLEKFKEGDTAGKKIAAVTEKEFTTMMPNLVQAYIQNTDRNLTLDTISERTTAWVKQWSSDLGDLMKLNSHTEIENILTKDLEAGVGVQEFTRHILESGIRDEYYKARRVAVTEVLRAHSVAQQEAFMQSPSVKQKMWKHTGEYRNQPRENHVAMDGQTVNVEDPFTLEGADGETYYPMYPRDTILPAGEAINCHCLCQPVVDEDILGMSLEERQELQQQAIDEMDDEWENELDEANRSKGIEEPEGKEDQQQEPAESETTEEPEEKQEAEPSAFDKVCQDFLSGENNDYAAVENAILDEYGISNVPVTTVSGKKNYGTTKRSISISTGEVTVKEIVLKADSKAGSKYDLETAFHEAYHAAANGLITDELDIGSKKYNQIEEVFAECSAMYKMEQQGVTGLVPAYSERIINILPRLQQLPEYSECKSLSDFGKVALDSRLAGGGTQFKETYSAAMKVRLNYVENVSKYIPEIRKNIGSYVSDYLEAYPESEGLKNKLAGWYEDAATCIEDTGEKPGAGAPKQVLEIFTAMAMNKIGVK